MIKTLCLAAVTLLLVGCPQFPVTPTDSPAPSTPSVSAVLEDSGGQKYVMIGDQPIGSIKLLKWNNNTKSWEKGLEATCSYDCGMRGKIQIYYDSINKPQTIFFYESSNKSLGEINTTTMTITKRQKFPNNYSFVSANEFIVYNGLSVESFLYNINVTSNLHMLPTLASVSAGLGLNIDSTKFKMLCTPENAYQWDRKTHFCIISNEVLYPNSDTATVQPKGDFYEVSITVQANGSYTYKLLNQGSYDANVIGGWPYETFPFPVLTEKVIPVQQLGVFTSTVQVTPTTQRADTFTIDNQGNLHLFYVLKDDPNIYYEYYTQNNPTTPLYTQVLP